MNRIEELIEKHCPDGVQFKELGTIVSAIRTGLNPRQNFKLNTKNAEHYYITVRELNGFTIEVSEKTDRVDSDSLSLIQNRSKIQAGDILFSGTGTIGRTAYVKEAPSNWNVKEGIYVITPIHNIIDSRFLIYLIHSGSINNQILSKSDGSTVSSISMASLKKILIPIPPLEVQEEIVKILDLFTTLEAELEAELEARKVQYTYYRDSLLRPTMVNGKWLMNNEEVEWMALGEICEVQSGGTPKKNKSEYWDKGTIKWLGSTVCKNKKTVEEVTDFITEKGLKNSSTKLFKKETTLIALVGATIGKVAFLPYEAATNQNVAGLYPKNSDELNTSYLFYSCKMLYEVFTNMSQDKLKMANLSFVRGLKIPIPPLFEQMRIVSILDKFDALVNDISVGLPAEIEGRRKQYEYYRNRLLTFKEVVSV